MQQIKVIFPKLQQKKNLLKNLKTQLLKMVAHQLNAPCYASHSERELRL